LPDAVAAGAALFLVIGVMVGGEKGSAETLLDPYSQRRPVVTYALWIVQGLLALLFLWAGGMKLVLPLDKLAGPIPLPGLFVRFIGVAEVLGAIGLILPGLLHIRPGLTPLAAAGLLIIMIGATVITLAGGAVGMAVMPLVVGLLLVFVAYGRWRRL
jgi:hypothetical protein